MRLKYVCLFLLAACSVSAAVKTQQFDFTTDGLLRMHNSAGLLTIEAWDKPAIEITSGTGDPAVEITAERHGSELVVTTVVPRRARGSQISYHLWVPRQTHLVIDHREGEVNVEGMAGDIEATVRQGQIFIYQPAGLLYSTTAFTKVGGINVPGDPRLKPAFLHLGQSLVAPASGKAHVLKLKVGYGDIYVLPQTTAPSSQSNPITN